MSTTPPPNPHVSGGPAPIIAALSDYHVKGERYHCPVCGHHKSDRLVVKVRDGGVVGLTCYAGCTSEQLVEAVGCGLADLYPPELRTAGRDAECPPPLAAFLATMRERIERAYLGERSGPTRRAILQALVNQAERQGTPTPEVAYRTAALEADVTLRTFHRHVETIIADGWLGIERRGGIFRGDEDGSLAKHSTRWRIGTRDDLWSVDAAIARHYVDARAARAHGWALVASDGQAQQVSPDPELGQAPDPCPAPYERPAADRFKAETDLRQGTVKKDALRAQQSSYSSVNHDTCCASPIPHRHDLRTGLGNALADTVSAVAEHGPQTIARIAARVGVTPAAMRYRVLGRDGKPGLVGLGILREAGTVETGATGVAATAMLYEIAEPATGWDEWAERLGLDGKVEERERAMDRIHDAWHEVVRRFAARACKHRDGRPSAAGVEVKRLKHGHLARLVLGRDRLVEDDRPLWSAVTAEAAPDRELVDLLEDLQAAGARLELSERLGRLWMYAPPDWSEPDLWEACATRQPSVMRMLRVVGARLLAERQRCQVADARASVPFEARLRAWANAVGAVIREPLTGPLLVGETA